MKRVINGKMYNTKTADLVADYANDLGCNDFKDVYEALYRTQKGNWFLYGVGGAMTRWKQAFGNMWGGGKGIVALTEQEAMQWCEDRFIPGEDVERYFTVEAA
jgi:hypothetical protein